MYLSENLKETLQRLYESTEKVIKRANFITEENMEEFLYKLEKRRYEIYNYREVMNAEKERDRENDYEEVEENYIEVFVTKANKIINLINESINENTNEKWQKNDTETGKNELEEFFQF